MNRLKDFIDIGVPGGMTPEEAKYIQMSNLGTLFMIAVNVPYMMLCIANRWTFIFIELCALNVLLSLTPLLNRFRHHTLALFYFGSLLNAHLVFVTVAMGKESMLYLLIFFTAGGAITLFRRNETKLMLIALAGIVGTYHVALVLSDHFEPLYKTSGPSATMLKIFVEYSLFALVVINSLIGRYGAIAAEDRLRQEQKRSERLLLRVQEQDQQKTQFFQNISHELRTPLTLILGPLESSLSGADGPLGESLRKKMDLMANNARRLLRLINQLLDLSKIDVGKLQLHAKRGNFSKFVDYLVDSFAPYAERNGITLKARIYRDDLQLSFDQEIIEKIISNLLSNACKFTPEGGEVLLSVSESDDRRSTIVSVKDTGPGIPPEELTHIFDRFHQVHGSTTREQEGTGIGLSLVKELVKIHGGTLDVTSAPKEGTEFVLSFPGAPEDAEAEGGGIPSDEAVDEPDLHYARLESSGLKSIRAADRQESDVSLSKDHETILVVEDNRDMRNFIRTGIEKEYLVIEAKNGEEGLKKAREFKPNLIISDVMMPKMDGYAMCRALRSDEDLSLIPIILLTAKASREMAIEGLESGAIDYITKPFSFNVLKAKIKALLKRQAEQEELNLTDNLTGLLKRAAWEQAVERELRKVGRYGGIASMAFIDLDDFKKVNDTHGHQTGDQVLVELSKTLVSELRSTDLAGRYGGEEFVIYLPESNKDEAAGSIERILELYRSKGIGESTLYCSFSAGVVEISGDRLLTAAEYVSRADAAMYEAKKRGKGRVTLWDDAMQTAFSTPADQR